MRYTLVVVWGFFCECCAAWRVGVWRVPIHVLGPMCGAPSMSMCVKECVVLVTVNQK